MIPPPDDTVKHHSMVRWYKPALLLRLAMRSIIATLVGKIADNREIQAALDTTQYDELRGAYDFSNEQAGADKADFWLDYVADLGDSWDSTFAVASQLARPEIALDGEPESLPRGHLLIMGGDEVYPDPSRQAYQERTIAPYSLAGQLAEMEKETDKPYLFALPGNHDWYDGLHAFDSIFCQARGQTSDSGSSTIASWNTCQKRSYFNIKLPGNWWLCGVDIQLGAGVNATQIAYFRAIAETMRDSDKIILCCATPEWLMAEIGETGMMQSLAEIMRVLAPSKTRIRLVLAGDVHHYSRYKAQEDSPVFITAGGGGAFLHPTHKLPEFLNTHKSKEQQPELKHCYPTKKTSFRLSHKLFWFPFTNWDFSLVIGAVYTMLAWFFEARTYGMGDPMSAIFMHLFEGRTPIGLGLMEFFTTIPKSPEFALIVFCLYLGFIRFNLTQRTAVSIGLGVAHALAHFMPFILTYFLASFVAMQITGETESVLNALHPFLIFIGLMFLLSSLLGSFVFGAYLWVALNIFGLQWTNAFSALRIADYRNFIRMRINRHGELTVYPLKIDKISHKKKFQHPGSENKAELIETPFTIR